MRKETKIVCGIDPGYDRLGIAFFDCKKNEILFSTCITTPQNRKDADRLNLAVKKAINLIKKHKPKIVGMEKLYFSKNIKTASSVYQTIGALKYAILDLNLKTEIKEYTPQKIKLAITGYGKSDKKAVHDFLIKTQKIDKNLIDDEVDAIAVSITTCFYG